MKPLSRLVLLAAMLLLPLAGAAKYIPGDKRAFPLHCNGVPCAIDTMGSRIYCSVKPVVGDSVDIVFTSARFDLLRFDLKGVAAGDTVRIANNFVRTHGLYFPGSYKRWTVCFTTLPIVLLDATNQIKDQLHPGYLTIIDPWCRTDGENSLFIHYAGVKVRGATSASYPKKPYGVTLWNDKNEEVDATVMGMRADGDVILDAMYIDKARMRNRVCNDFWNKVDSLPYVGEGEKKINGTEGFFVEVLLNGQYHGLYCLTDKIDRKKLHLKKYKVDPSNGAIAQHGVLYKAVEWSDATHFNGYDAGASINHLYWQGWEQKYPDDSESLANWTPLRNLVKFSSPYLSPNKNTFSALVPRRFHEQNLVNYVLFLAAFHIYDNTCKNTYISYEDVKNSPSRALITPWDMDASLGRNWDGSLLDEVGFDKLMGDCGLFRRLIDDNASGFHRKIHDTWLRWRQTCFSVDSFAAHINAYRDLFKSSGAYQRETMRWPNTLNPIDTEAKYIVDWYARSVECLDDFMKDYPTGIDDVMGGSNYAVAITARGGRIVVDALVDARARVSIFRTDGTPAARGESALPYESEALASGIYIVNVKIGGTTVRKKVAVP